MKFERAFVPANGTWSSPFCKWQGTFSTLHPLKFAADVTAKALQARNVSMEDVDDLVFGWTIPFKQVFYGTPWLAGMLGAPGLTGAMVSQACATSVAAATHAAARVETGACRASLVVLADKTSNGPNVYYPNPRGMGGTGDSENWVVDAFSHDPWAKNAMIQTAENVAAEENISREAQDALTMRRYEQYRAGIESGFAAHYMVAPYEVNPNGRRVIATVTHDEGIFETTTEGLAKLRPVVPEGTVTFGSQTHPADGNAGMLVCDEETATRLGGGETPVQLLSAGQARVEKGRMAKAVVPAARRALDAAGIKIQDCAVIKTHNPFAVNDLYFAREMGIEAEGFNNNGSSLIFGHPQAPTGARLIAEALAEARLAGGGYVLFAGCAAGDTAAALVLKA